MKSSTCVLLLCGVMLVFSCPWLLAQETAKSAQESVAAALLPDRPFKAVNQADASEGIAVGYRGHYACRSFSGVARSLAIAVSDFEPAVVSQLLAAGADINSRATVDHAHGMTLLQTAVLHQWGLESVRLLVKGGADVDARDRRGDTALTIACRNSLGSNRDVVVALIQSGAAVDGKGAGGVTPLMCAAVNDDSGDVVEALIDASADVNARDKRGWTPLMHATRRRREHIEIVQSLVEAGAQVNARHDSGGTALSNAAYNGHLQSVRFLLVPARM